MGFLNFAAELSPTGLDTLADDLLVRVVVAPLAGSEETLDSAAVLGGGHDDVPHLANAASG